MKIEAKLDNLNITENNISARYIVQKPEDKKKTSDLNPTAPVASTVVLISSNEQELIDELSGQKPGKIYPVTINA